MPKQTLLKLKSNLLTQLFEQRALVALIVMTIVLAFWDKDFFTLSNWLNILTQNSVVAVLAAGMTLVILTGGIDLSVGSVLALTGAVAASLVARDWPLMLSIPLTLALGAALGALSGLIITKGRVQAFIATLVMMILLRGVAKVYMDSKPISTGFSAQADAFAWFAEGQVLGVPAPIALFVSCFLLVGYLLSQTRFGRYIYAVGSNEVAAQLSGIRVARIKIGVYALCGLFSALAGIILTSRLSTAQTTAGEGYELDAIAAVVVGGTSLAGGRGRILGTLIGLLIIGVLDNALNLLDVSANYQKIIKALVILLAVLLDRNKHH